MGELNSRMDKTEERVSEHGGKTIQIPQSEERKIDWNKIK